ncbi:CidA/LrgA family protein [Bacillus solimangrovi]|uniref:Murein hydrolase transporter LrgA n=1 Tax=Bacillus solimangrovi TaxID=1305675 RepID=A0A1E5LCK7_9BACI|nr:CidA/LrgA family holin-like protein [Bacillus solimangrovi]OEH91769.1 murein hydrolase transporter LrgA [Bacillus solimangrovi]
MKWVRFISQIAILFGFYYIGVGIQVVLNLFIPGSIIGMLLLFVLLKMNVIKLKWIDGGASFLLSHLPLLFIPVTVGIIDYFSLFKGKGFLSLIVVILSTVIVMISSAYASQFIAIRKEREQV